VKKRRKQWSYDSAPECAVFLLPHSRHPHDEVQLPDIRQQVLLMLSVSRNNYRCDELFGSMNNAKLTTNTRLTDNAYRDAYELRVTTQITLDTKAKQCQVFL
jgi:hypothetical protein